MILRTILIVFVFLLCSSQNNAQSLLRNNFEILDSLTNLTVLTLFLEIEKQNIEKANLVISDHSAKWLVKQYMLENAKKTGFEFAESDDNNRITFEIIIKNAGVQYQNYSESNDSLDRYLSVILTGSIKYADGKVESLKEKELTYHDIIYREDVPLISSREHDFANAAVPEKPTTFFEDIFGPVIAVGSAALIVLLLFSVRSG